MLIDGRPEGRKLGNVETDGRLLGCRLGAPDAIWLVLGRLDGSSEMDRCSLGIDVGLPVVGGVNISLGCCVGEREYVKGDEGPAEGCKVG